MAQETCTNYNLLVNKKNNGVVLWVQQKKHIAQIDQANGERDNNQQKAKSGNSRVINWGNLEKELLSDRREITAKNVVTLIRKGLPWGRKTMLGKLAKDFFNMTDTEIDDIATSIKQTQSKITNNKPKGKKGAQSKDQGKVASMPVVPIEFKENKDAILQSPFKKLITLFNEKPNAKHIGDNASDKLKGLCALSYVHSVTETESSPEEVLMVARMMFPNDKQLKAPRFHKSFGGIRKQNKGWVPDYEWCGQLVRYVFDSISGASDIQLELAVWESQQNAVNPKGIKRRKLNFGEEEEQGDVDKDEH